MTRQFVAEFADPAKLRQAAVGLHERGECVREAFTPFRMEGLDEVLGVAPSRIRPAMFVGGVGAAALMYAIEWWSAVHAYPFNSGGRPLHSWPVFLLVPFEVGVFGAAIVGFVTLLWSCGLPRLHHPLFEVPGFERASQDRFFLLAETHPSDEDGLGLRHALESTGARVVTEVPAR